VKNILKQKDYPLIGKKEKIKILENWIIKALIKKIIKIMIMIMILFLKKSK